MPAALDARQRHAAQLLAAGDDQATTAAKLGVNPSTVSRWAARDEFAALVERERSKRLKAVRKAADKEAPTAPTKTTADLDLAELARSAAVTAWGDIVRRRRAGEAIPIRELVQTADALRKFAERDSDGASAEAIASALADDKTLAGVVDALGPAGGQRVWEALSKRLEADLGLDDERVRWVFQHTGVIYPLPTANVIHHLWAPVVALMAAHAAKLAALHRHREVCARHGDEPDLASIDAVHPVHPAALLEAARAEMTRIAEKEDDHEAA